MSKPTARERRTGFAVVLTVLIVCHGAIFEFCQYAYIEIKCGMTDASIEKTKHPARKDYLDKHIFGGYSQVDVTGDPRISSMTMLYFVELKSGNVNLKIIRYRTFFEDCYEVIYDNEGLELRIIPIYE